MNSNFLKLPPIHISAYYKMRLLWFGSSLFHGFEVDPKCDHVGWYIKRPRLVGEYCKWCLEKELLQFFWGPSKFSPEEQDHPLSSFSWDSCLTL